MLSDNLIYIYDQKFEHDGPYKNLKMAVTKLTDKNDKSLNYSVVAAGVLKIDGLKIVDEVNLYLGKNKIHLIK